MVVITMVICDDDHQEPTDPTWPCTIAAGTGHIIKEPRLL